MSLCTFFFSCDWHSKSTLYCNGFNSLGRTTTFEVSFFQDSHSFGIFLCKVCHFQNAYSVGIFFCEVCQFYRFQNSHSIGNLKFSLRSLPFSEDFADFRCTKEYALREIMLMKVSKDTKRKVVKLLSSIQEMILSQVFQGYLLRLGSCVTNRSRYSFAS